MALLSAQDELVLTQHLSAIHKPVSLVLFTQTIAGSESGVVAKQVLSELAHLNDKIYIPMQGPSELGASGKLEKWDRSKDLAKITVPTLVIGAEHDSMDPKHMEWMARQFPQGSFVLCPEGGHMAFYDDPEPYFKGLPAFLKDVEGMP